LLQALSKNKLTAAAAVRVLVVRMVLSLKSMPGNVPLASRFRQDIVVVLLYLASC
jgi:hypothetical protein